MKKPKKNPHAAALGALRCAHAREFRWSKREERALLKKIDEDSAVI